MKTKLLKRLRKETKDSFSVSIKNGFYFIHYILIDGELVCRTLDLNKTQKKNLKQMDIVEAKGLSH